MWTYHKSHEERGCAVMQNPVNDPSGRSPVNCHLDTVSSFHSRLCKLTWQSDRESVLYWNHSYLLYLSSSRELRTWGLAERKGVLGVLIHTGISAGVASVGQGHRTWITGVFSSWLSQSVQGLGNANTPSRHPCFPTEIVTGSILPLNGVEKSQPQTKLYPYLFGSCS